MKSNSVVVVVGAGGGVGRSVSQTISARGHSVRRCDVKATDGVERVDATDREQFARWMRQAVSSDQQLYGLVNCQGMWRPEHWTDITEDSVRSSLTSNLISVINTSVEAARLMTSGDGGRIVTIGSIAAEQGSTTPSAAYAAAKGGVVSFSKSLARELARSGITVNVVSPGPIESPMLAAMSDDELSRRRDALPIGRLVTPDEVAAAVDHLLDPRSGSTTGQVIRVNGGAYM